MVSPVDHQRFSISEVVPAAATAARYDLGFWAAGYEERSGWLVRSVFRPPSVGRWWKVELEEHQTALSGPSSRTVPVGEILGGSPGRQDRDGEWLHRFHEAIGEASALVGRPIDIFIDYSSMPRAVYGTFLVDCLRQASSVRSITFAYVPGVHGADLSGSRGIEGLRSLIGLDGQSTHDGVAFILGLGYDGILSETIIELFQVAHFSCLYADPGVSEGGVQRALHENAELISRAELVSTAPAWSVGEAFEAFLRLHDWYADTRDVLLVPLGPKPHVLAGLLAAAMRPEISYRFPQTSRVRPVQVSVAEKTVPYFTRIAIGGIET